MIDPHVHVTNVAQFKDWATNAPPGQWCSYQPARPKDKSPLTVKVREAYDAKKVLMFQQRRSGRAEYLACRVSRKTWDEVEAASRRASDTPMSTMKAKIQDFLAGKKGATA